MNMNKKQRNILTIAAAVLLAVVLAVVFPSRVTADNRLSGSLLSHNSQLISQKEVATSLDPQEIIKIYDHNQLIGILYDASLLDQAIEEKRLELVAENGSDDIRAVLSSKVYTIRQQSFTVYENKDEEIISYLKDNGLFVPLASQIEFLKDGEVTDTIYVYSLDQFNAALKEFVLKFVDEDVYNRLNKGETIETIQNYGSQDVNVYIQEEIRVTEDCNVSDNVLKSQEEILQYLCYKPDTEMKYYTVEDYETIQSAAYHNNISTRQLLIYNPQIADKDQLLSSGMQLNITPFNSPISVVTEVQSLVREITYPESPIYRKDESVPIGQSVIVTQEADGYNNDLYTEYYINGESVAYKLESSEVAVAPVTAVILVGSDEDTYHGSIIFGLPCRDAKITCGFTGCYEGHTGVDFVVQHHPRDFNGYVLSVTDGTVITRGYSANAGNYYRIDAGTDSDGHRIVLRYGHMAVPGYYAEGTVVKRGQIIGEIGNTGLSTGPHVHVSIYLDGDTVDPCIYIPCEFLPHN